MEASTAYSRNSPTQSSNFKLTVKKAGNVNQTVDYGSQGLPSIHNHRLQVMDNARTLKRDQSQALTNRSNLNSILEGGPPNILTIRNPSALYAGNSQHMPSVYGAEDFHV